MQNKNNYSLKWTKGTVEGEGIFNGDIGIIESISVSDGEMTVLFDDKIRILHNRRAIRDVEPITPREYTIGGLTVLYDALGGAVETQVMLQRSLPNKEKADKVVFAIITDGYENASVIG